MSVGTLVVDRGRMTDRLVSHDLPPDQMLEVTDRFAAGDEQALETIYRAHGRLVYSFCRRAVGEHRAADVTQEVFIAAWRSRDRYRSDAGPVVGWLMGIARFKVIDHLRRESRHPLAPEHAQQHEHAVDATDVEQMAQRMLVAEALEQLSDRSRAVVRAAFFDDRTHAQIAESSGLPLGTVKSDIRRGLDRLRQHLEAFDDAPRS